MKLRFLQCKDFLLEDVEVPDYGDISKLKKAIKDGEVIAVKSMQDGLIDYINSIHIVSLGVYE